MTPILANSLWLAGCLPELARFRRAATRVRAEQAAVLRQLIAANARSEFGRQHGFRDLRSVDDYRARVPLASFEDLAPSIDRAAAGTGNVLTGDRIKLFEPTSGSSGPTKLIPSTAALQREFQRGIRPWIANLFLAYPELMAGQAYWSITPSVTARRRTLGGIPVGFDDDSAYLGGWQQRLVRSVMVAPTTIDRPADTEAFLYQTLLALVRAAKLRLISIWSPTFLSLLVERLPAWGEALERDLRGDGRAGARLKAALTARTPAERNQVLWPHLGLISCWADANATAAAAHLSTLFPHVRMQGKGLIATEGFVSLPWIGREGSALAVRSHFLEFAPVGAVEDINETELRLADELEAGRRYAVILSTGGGLYRYRLGDVVEVVGFLAECPLVRFVGRSGYVSDWFGEKLNEAHVARVLSAAFERCAIGPSFAMLACDTTLSPPAYVLYLDAAAPDSHLEHAINAIEGDLRANFQYDYARRLGQLGPARVVRSPGAARVHLAAAIEGGGRAGGVKPLALDRRDGWSRKFGLSIC
ncbi:MAG: GH3 auxin-responsive promoter family protein [Vicinamibacterales bacterium]